MRFMLSALSWHPIYILFGLGILSLDALTGPFLLFPVFFVLPVVLAAWFGTAGIAYSLAVLLPVGRFCIDYFVEHLVPPHYAVINEVIDIAVLGFIAFLVHRTANQTKALKQEVKLLETILPMCMGCRRLRDEHNNWQLLEVYVTEHTDSVVSHGLCPECAKTLYPDVFNGDRNA